MKAVHEAFGDLWPRMSLRDKLKCIHLVYGFKFWYALSAWGMRMQQRHIDRTTPQEEDE